MKRAKLRNIRRLTGLLSIAALCWNSWFAAAGSAQQPPSVMKPPSRTAQLPNAGMTRGPAKAAPVQPNGAAPALPVEATQSEAQPLPTNPGQMLLKEAAEKAKTAQQDGDFSEVIAIAGEGMKEKPGAAGEAYGKKLLAWAHNRRGQILSQHGLHQQATEDFTAAIDYDPTLWRAWHNRGVSQAGAGNKQAAMADFNKSLEMNRSYANTWYNRAELLFEAGKFDLAARDFNEAIRLNNQDGAAIVGRGKCYARMNKMREALLDFDAAVRVDPKNAALRLQRAEAYAGIKAFATAIEDYKAAIAIEPQSGPAYRGLAWIMATCPDAKLRNAEQAVSLAQKAMELEGNQDSRYVETLAAAFANSGQFEAAAELLKQTGENLSPAETQRRQAQIAVYQAGKPWRDGPETNVAQQPRPNTAGNTPNRNVPQPPKR